MFLLIFSPFSRFGVVHREKKARFFICLLISNNSINVQIELKSLSIKTIQGDSSNIELEPLDAHNHRNN